MAAPSKLAQHPQSESHQAPSACLKLFAMVAAFLEGSMEMFSFLTVVLAMRTRWVMEGLYALIMAACYLLPVPRLTIVQLRMGVHHCAITVTVPPLVHHWCHRRTSAASSLQVQSWRSRRRYRSPVPGHIHPYHLSLWPYTNPLCPLMVIVMHLQIQQ